VTSQGESKQLRQSTRHSSASASILRQCITLSSFASYYQDYIYHLGADVCITFKIRFKKLLLLISTHCSAHYNVVRRNTAFRIFLPAIFSYNIPSFRLRHRYLQNTSTVYFKALIRVIMTLVSILTIEIAVQQSVVVFNGWPTPSY